MNLTQHAPAKLLERALVVFVGLLLVSLLIIFAIEPSIYTTTLWPGWAPTERYPWPVLLFLGALTIFLCILMFGAQHVTMALLADSCGFYRFADSHPRRELARLGGCSSSLTC